MRVLLSLVLAVSILVLVLPRIDWGTPSRVARVESPSPGVALPASRPPPAAPSRVDSPAAEPGEPAGAFYRWRAADGTVHITSDPPPGPYAVEVFYFRRGPSPDGVTRPASREPNRSLGPIGLPWVEDPTLTNILDHVGKTLERLGARKQTMDSLKRQL